MKKEKLIELLQQLPDSVNIKIQNIEIEDKNVSPVFDICGVDFENGEILIKFSNIQYIDSEYLPRGYSLNSTCLNPTQQTDIIEKWKNSGLLDGLVGHVSDENKQKFF